MKGLLGKACLFTSSFKQEDIPPDTIHFSQLLMQSHKYESVFFMQPDTYHILRKNTSPEGPDAISL